MQPIGGNGTRMRVTVRTAIQSSGLERRRGFQYAGAALGRAACLLYAGPSLTSTLHNTPILPPTDVGDPAT
jgi:hypothetical protein